MNIMMKIFEKFFNFHMFIVKNVRERFQSYFETQVEKQILHTQIANIPMLNS